MLSSVVMENYKSINKLSLELGRVNVFIGENGCGKSNILEALCLASSAEADKLDNNFLSSRGVRVTSAKLMRSHFNKENINLPIKVTIKDDGQCEYILENNNKPYSAWTYQKKSDEIENEKTNFFNLIANMYLENFIEKNPSEYDCLDGDLEEKKRLITSPYIEIFKGDLEKYDSLKKDFESFKVLEDFNNFIIYSPENSALRNFYEEGQLEPLGVNGAGLLKLLKVINETDAEGLKDIKDALDLFGWYADIEIPTSLDKSNDKISIKDKYIDTIIDQRSANEGFLFVLFYVALIVSKDTPKIFAIDNIDASLNPKLCTKIMELIVQLCTKYDKQVFLTTHNPAILDGLNVHDEQQCLFVISRNNDGHTKAKKVSNKKSFQTADGGTLKFSEAFLRGYLKALPKGF